MADRILKTDKNVVVDVKYHFNDRELQELGDQVAHYVKEKTGIEAEKKVSMDEFKRRIERVEEKIGSCSEKILDRFEIRPTSCRLFLNFTTEMREYFYQGVLVHSEQLKDDDYQLKLQFQAEQSAMEAESEVDEQSA